MSENVLGGGIRSGIKNILSTLSPRFTTYLMYLYNFRRLPDFDNPKDINDWLQKLKLGEYYHNPVITQCVDKYRVRDYITNKGLEKILPDLYVGGIENPDELRSYWEKFPDALVIKCNHGCGYNMLINDKRSVNMDDAISQLKEWLEEDHWKKYCEPQYMDVKKCVLAEEYLGDEIKTYKFYCFNGEPKVLYVSANGANGEKDLYLDYFDMDWNWMDLTLEGHLHNLDGYEKPVCFDEMIKVSRILAKDFPFVRVDLYDVAGKVYFSELTFIPTGGNMKLTPSKYLIEWGEWMKK